MAGTEVQPHDREFAFDDGTDLDQLEADRLAGGLGQLGAGERQTADRFDQGIGQRGE